MKSWIVVLFVLLSFTMRAKDLDMLNLINSDGLSNSSINKIFQDAEGLIWIGTWDGLNVYDGREITVYKPEPGNFNSISNNIIRDIVEQDRNTIWIATDNGINRLDKSTKKFSRYLTRTNSGNTHNENLFFIANNSKNEIFSYISEQGLYYYNRATEQFVNVSGVGNLRVKKIFFDSKDNLWILTLDRKLLKITLKKSHSAVPEVEHIIDFDHLKGIESAFFQQGDILWLQTDDKNLYKYCSAKDSLVKYLSIDKSDGIIKTLIFSQNHLLWGTESGLFRFNIQTHKRECLLENISILSLCAGTQSIIWVGTDVQGVMQFYPSRARFNQYTDKSISKFGRHAVRTFHQDRTGTLWIGTKGGGIYGLRRNNNSEELYVDQHLTTKNGLSSNSVFTITKADGDEFWIGTDGHGVDYFEHNTIKSLSCENMHQERANLTSIYSILMTDSNTLWVGTSGNGMYKIEIDRSTNPYSVKSHTKYTYTKDKPSSLSSNIVYSIIKEDENNLWIGTRGGGVNLFNIKKEHFETYSFSNNTSDLYGCDDVLSLHKGAKGELWIGSSIGLIKFVRRADEKPLITHFTEKDGLPNNTVHGILEDSNNNIWLSTNKGVAQLIQQPKSPRIVCYYQKDGLQSDEFSDGAFYKCPTTNTFYFGGINGFNAFNPLEITEEQYMPSLVLDAFYVDNTEEVVPKLSVADGQKRLIKISHQTKSFSFKFVPIDYLSSQKCEISYLLEGYQKDWINIGTSNTIVFSNLPKGEYALKVRCTNSDKIWSNEEYTLTIIVQSAWWRSNVAYCCYMLLLLVIIYLINRAVKAQAEIRNKIKAKELEEQKIAEIHQAKLRFFTNIAHEFSNSLTLIYGPSMQLLRNLPHDNANRKYINTIKTNSERMQNLIQQLIDFRKAETGYLKLNIERVDIPELVRFTASNFSDILEKREIKISLCFIPDNFYWNSDWNCIEKIVFNLISNAAKYTPHGENIEIAVEVKNNVLCLKVKNYGIGIKEDDQKNIFNRFETLNRFEMQLSEGIVTRNGIGLALCKSVAEVLNGNIEVESDGQTYTGFLVTIPQGTIPQPATDANPKVENHSETFGADYTLEEKKKEWVSDGFNGTKTDRILVVDDEPEIRQLLIDCIGAKYTVMEASNGKEAIVVMSKKMPILIICDVIMPEMDGIEFIKIVKGQEFTRHIPIILLSSKAAVESQIEGLEVGADAYIGKPFHPQLLEALIDSLFKRNRAVIDYSESAYASMEQFEGKLIKKADSDLILKIAQFVIDHIDDENLSLDYIAIEIGISKMQLYRKTKDIISMSPIEFIRSIRLNHARKLLITTNKTVQEIIYDCGFNNKTYFYREFAKRFQQTPNVYRKQNHHPVQKGDD